MVQSQSYIALALLLGLALAPRIPVGRRFLQRHIGRVFWVVVAILLATDTLIAFLQYRAWQGGALSRLLLPAYQGGYFYFYSFTRFFANHLVALGFALLLLWVMTRLNRRSGGQFFEKEEPYLAATTLFLVGHPGWLIYIVALTILYLGWHLRQGSTERLPLYNFWASVGFFVTLFNLLVLQGTVFWAVLGI